MTLQVEATIGTGVATAGLAGPAFASVSVVDSTGAPLNLQEHEFRFAVIASPRGMLEPMTHRLNTPRDDGFHFFTLFPRTGDISERWSAGEYLIGIRVSTASGQGQTVGLLRVPESTEIEEAVASPEITSLDPYEVDQGWEGVVKIHGRNFDEGSFPLFNSDVPRSTRKSDSLLIAHVTDQITGTPGAQTVKVHSGGGSVSNEKTFTVRETN